MASNPNQRKIMGSLLLSADRRKTTTKKIHLLVLT
jgi:hypothetical protein